MPIKTSTQAAAIQGEYYARGKAGYAPSVKRYLKSMYMWDEDTRRVVSWFPYFMPHRLKSVKRRKTNGK